MKIYIATHNQKKLTELRRILEPMGFEVLSQSDFEMPEVEETGTSFEENALLKARAGLAATGLVSAADDSGLCVDALDGAPGIFSARYSGADATDEKNNEKLLQALRGVPYEKRTAHYAAAIACIFPDGRFFTVRGECHGHIAETPRGSGGFGYDPLFLSERGCFGELSAEEKDAISHRGRALAAFREKLKEYIGQE